jgi:hypothetical protein
VRAIPRVSNTVANANTWMCWLAPERIRKRSEKGAGWIAAGADQDAQRRRTPERRPRV